MVRFFGGWCSWLSAVFIAVQVVLGALAIFTGGNVPLHWDAGGDVDSSGSAYNMLLLPVVSILVYFMMTFFEKHPQYCNWPHGFKDEHKGFRLMAHLVGVLKLLAVMFLTFISYEAYCGEPFNYVVAALFLVAVFVVVCIYARRLRRA